MQSQTQSTTPTLRRSSHPHPAENAFTPHFLSEARHREASAHPQAAPGTTPLARQALWTGPWEVEQVRAGGGVLHAVTRRAEPAGESGGARWVSPHRQDALLAAAAFAALATPNHLSLNPASRGGSRLRLGHPVHDGPRHLGHLTKNDDEFLAALHTLRALAANPDAAALFLEALDHETLNTLGRAALRRLG